MQAKPDGHFERQHDLVEGMSGTVRNRPAPRASHLLVQSINVSAPTFS